MPQQSSFFDPVIQNRNDPVNVGFGYQNMYGTTVGLSGDPRSKALEGRIEFPIGDVRRGRSFSASGSYGPGGLSAFVGFSKRNLSSDPQLAAQQLGLDDPTKIKQEFGFTVNDPRYTQNTQNIGSAFAQPRMAGDVFATPANIPNYSNGIYDRLARQEAAIAQLESQPQYQQIIDKSPLPSWNDVFVSRNGYNR